MEEQGGSLPSFFPGRALHALLLLVATLLLLLLWLPLLLVLLLDVEDSGSATTVEDTRDVSGGCADAGLDILGAGEGARCGGGAAVAGCGRGHRAVLASILATLQLAASAARLRLLYPQPRSAGSRWR